MLYLSQLLGTLVEVQQNNRLGRVSDIVIPRATTPEQPGIRPLALLVEGEEERPWRVPFEQVERRESGFELLVAPDQLALQPDPPPSQEIQLAREVLDKQVIDLKHKKAVRVNDICFSDEWQLLGIDTTSFGLVRRLAPAWLVNKNRPTTTILPWSDIELLDDQQDSMLVEQSGTTPMAQGRIPSGQLAELHPADIAHIITQLSSSQGARIIESLDNETAADTMEEIDTDQQRRIIENIQPRRAAAILAEMGPDEVADLLGELPEERVQELLRLMTPEESEDVQDLLEYEEDSAGGLMTTDFIILDQTRTVSEAMERIRAEIRENDIQPAYIYCVVDETQEESRVLGVVSLWELLIASPSQLLQEIMEKDIISVRPEDHPRAVAETMAKYNLLAIPVVNNEGILEGVITVDDALDVLLPAERRHRSRRMY